MLSAANRILRVEPREWFRSQVDPSARIVIAIHSEWALPPIFDLNLKIAYKWFDIPYKNLQALAAFHPPDIDRLGKDTDLVILNDFHRRFYGKVMRQNGLSGIADEWEKFQDLLAEKFQVMDFSAPSPSYDVSHVRVVIVNPAVIRPAR